MTGTASLLGMPLGIILRNTSRAGYNSSKGKYLYTSRIIGGLAAAATVAAGTFFGAPFVAAALGAGFIGTWGAYVAAGAVSALLLPIPAFTVATLASSTLVAGVVAAFSTLIAAPVNLLVAFRRSKAGIKGHKLTEDEMENLQTEFDRRSPTVKYQQDLADTITESFSKLSSTKKTEVFASLHEQFGAASVQDNEQLATTPSKTTSQPKP